MIRKISAFLVLSLVLTISGMALQPNQEPSFSFKGTYLGMPLTEFRELNRKEVLLPSRTPPVTKKEKKHPLTEAAEGPLCSDQYDLGYLIKSLNFAQAATPAPIAPPIKGEIVCFTTGAPYTYSAIARTPSVEDANKKKHKKHLSKDPWNLSGRTVNGMEAINLSYRFYEGKLYRIHMWFTSAQMKIVKDGFFLKYGDPQFVDLDDYANAFDLNWKAESFLWTNKDKDKCIRLHMGDGFGPGQDLYKFDGTASADFVDNKVKQLLHSTLRTSNSAQSPENTGTHLDF